MLEIGIGGYDDRSGGQSLNAWQCFFPFAKVIACDVRDKSFLATPRTIIKRLDQSSEDELRQLRDEEGPFDIIVDDGSHLNAHQLLTFKTLWPALRPGGVYVIEDVQTSYWNHEGWDGAPIEADEFADTCVGFFAKLAPYVNGREFKVPGNKELTEIGWSIRQVSFEHNLVVVIKK
jgi:8-demethyl-8-alpha-L-rhamnosyltetracenomycin-C 2'-O-methyltransferase